MAPNTWQEAYADKLLSAPDALSHVRSGHTVFVSSGAGEPHALTDTLAGMADRICSVEVIQSVSAPCPEDRVGARAADCFRHRSIVVGESGVAPDFTPMRPSELPAAMHDRVIPIDVALIMVSPPDPIGLCSLGVSVDAAKAAVESAGIVIAQVNELMPVTLGDTHVAVDDIDYLVDGTAPLAEIAALSLDPVSLTIGRHVARLIQDGMTLHLDSCAISAATLRHLDTRRDLGIHTHALTDDIMRLIRSRAVTNRRKGLHDGRTVATMVLGSRELYEWTDRNPYVELLPIDHVSDPHVIGENRAMVAILGIKEIDVTGLPVADTSRAPGAPSLPSGMDFLMGARRSRGGFSVLALPSTTPDGQGSRIVAQNSGDGVAFSRARVDYVATEYGVVNLRGLSIRERAIALCSIAHPRFRPALLEESQDRGYVDPAHPLPTGPGNVYPHHYEFTRTLKDGTEVFFRPVKPTDARRLQRLFYTLSPESIRLRYHGMIKLMSDELATELAAVDFSRDMAIVGLVGPRTAPQIIAEGRYMFNPANGMGEFDILVHEGYRGRGIGLVLANYLNHIAYSRGLNGVYAEVMQDNAATMALLKRAWPTAQKTFREGCFVHTVRFPEADIRRPKDSIIVHSGRFGDYSYGEDHPFDPGRSRRLLRVIQDQAYLSEPWMRVEEPQLVTRERLVESHDPAYVEALALANDGQWRPEFEQFHLGTDDCPVFPGLFDYVLLYTSATITGVDLIAEQSANVVFSPIGGFHHASREHAEGFSYANDVLVAIDMLLARGYRVAYIDIDAHHGNGVQDAYYRDDRVLFVSLHESGTSLYPGSGFETEIGEDIGRGYTINIPLPRGTDDDAFTRVFARIVPPAVQRFAPTVVVAVVGADTHKDDPLSHLSLTNNGMVAVMEQIRDFSSQLLMLGGGGYNPRSTCRAWSRMWAAANRIDSLPDYLLGMGGTFLGSGGDAPSVVDMAYQVWGDEKAEILAELERIATFHEEHTLPHIRSDGQ